MKRILITAALVSAAMLSAAQAQTIGTATTGMNIRSGPDPQYPVIGMLRDRQRVTVLGCVEGSRWCQVDFRGQTGWAYSRYLTLSGDVAAVLPAPEIEVDATVVAAPPPVVAYRAPAPAVTYQAPARVVTYPAPAVTYQAPAPAVTYQTPAPLVAYQTAPAVTYQTAPAVAYQTAPVTTYRAPATVVETTAAAPRDFAGRLIPPRETVYAATSLPPAYVPPRAVRTYITANTLDPVYLEGTLTVGAGIPDDIGLMPVPGSRYNYAYVNDYPVLVDPGTRRIVYVSR